MSGTNSIRNKLRGIIALALAFVLFAALGTYGHAANIDLDKDCTLTVSPTSELSEDIKDANVVVDLYKVASAVAVDGYDTYDLKAESAFSSLDVALDPEKTDSDWEKIAKEAAEIVLAEGSSVKPVVEGKALDEKITGLKAGLYLVVPHGSDLDEYIETLNDTTVTIANSPMYKYSFTPNLIALPTKEDGSTAADAGDWVTDAEIEIKADREIRVGSIEIIKSWESFIKKNDGPATIVFEVHVYQGDEELKDLAQTVTMTFESGESQTYRIDNLPLGSKVVVKEIYDGGKAGKCISKKTQEAIVSLEEVAQVEFVNTFDDRTVRHGSITNTFTYEPGGWTLEQKFN